MLDVGRFISGLTLQWYIFGECRTRGQGTEAGGWELFYEIYGLPTKTIFADLENNKKDNYVYWFSPLFFIL